MMLILGAGYTGSRVARLLEQQGHQVLKTHRSEVDVLRPATVAEYARRLPEGVRILHSVPLVRRGEEYVRPTPVLEPILRKASRIVYLSTTGVYGATHEVDEHTAPAPRHARERLRVEEEEDVRRMCASVLVLRPAAIYGPGRGVHVALREGTHKLWGDGGNYISRIHVDDLARLCAAALEGELTGAYPVADEHPCPAREITEYCAELVGVAPPAPLGRLAEGDTRGGNRRVDGRAIWRAVGASITYLSYREGILAALEEERRLN
jgi:nucleoside-diphosphate-sugar epimerase